ncbi:hypothetical protein H4R34_005651 [Dimargaris verticillata]|uniref:RING-type domain-containing protein n=1 Tax=Dimargaris verticillata TaxID=2761393 RepID=A0A9W8B2I8_9FUNG|nr:hypothetical protein H4R34_005651 [Dimargaris verticillata]
MAGTATTSAKQRKLQPFKVLREHTHTLCLLHQQTRQVNQLRKELERLQTSFAAANACRLCTAEFTLPHTLQCGHSFCQDCLQQHLRTERECPICRQTIVHRPAPAVNLEYHAKLLESLDKLALPSDIDDGIAAALDGLFGSITQGSQLKHMVETQTITRPACSRLHSTIKTKVHARLTTGAATNAAAGASNNTTPAAAPGSAGARRYNASIWDVYWPAKIPQKTLKDRTLLVVCSQCSNITNRPACRHCPAAQSTGSSSAPRIQPTPAPGAAKSAANQAQRATKGGAPTLNRNTRRRGNGRHPAGERSAASKPKASTTSARCDKAPSNDVNTSAAAASSARDSGGKRSGQSQRNAAANTGTPATSTGQSRNSNSNSRRKNSQAANKTHRSHQGKSSSAQTSTYVIGPLDYPALCWFFSNPQETFAGYSRKELDITEARLVELYGRH